MSLASALAQGLQTMQCALDGDQQSALLAYIALLEKWNKVYNLTAVRDPVQMVPQHLLDALSIRPYLAGTRILDVGTGAGLPGIPLAIAEPGREFVLLDSALKRTRFVTQAVGELGLQNVEVIQARVESYQPPELFDTITSRAFTATEDFVAATGHLLTVDGQLLAMKGKLPEQEINKLPNQWLCKAYKLAVPGVVGERHVLQIKRNL
ncbi:16S rRNA (guanine(527)-N(7))-methyltransferase RsmG [Sulfuriflexus sp.]|uniref:16S rRNA (guanine(527)-N(7))-methyltransferase RsmG n=1 Tax=Sulfuriflexus sp. TaxID=2015443 RepID=UPI0028CFAE0C|nr:16S rRNA (guanine(527)-N(7))-methyltransferase RsmG [Sulfuriflexus sp.]MDT8404096.1 16S rRNA (guanine(527)-N(7))-methyltransferase RsmG [Sulfuriflexus sp.]